MFCEKCGTKVKEDAVFCQNCGTSCLDNQGNQVQSIPAKKSKSHWKSIVSVIVGILVFVVVRAVVQEGTKSLLTSSSTETIEESLTKALPEMNKDLPKKVDEITQLTSITSSGKNINYNYKVDDKGLQLTQKELNTSLKSDVVKGVCTTSETKSLVDKGVVFIYNYYKYSGLYIGTLSVNSSDCK
jgi:uncharacterized membrane protein YvbJ